MNSFLDFINFSHLVPPLLETSASGKPQEPLHFFLALLGEDGKGEAVAIPEGIRITLKGGKGPDVHLAVLEEGVEEIALRGNDWTNQRLELLCLGHGGSAYDVPPLDRQPWVLIPVDFDIAGVRWIGHGVHYSRDIGQGH